jgi:hypothetical protein
LVGWSVTDAYGHWGKTAKQGWTLRMSAISAGSFGHFEPPLAQLHTFVFPAHDQRNRPKKKEPNGYLYRICATQPYLVVIVSTPAPPLPPISS